LNVRCVVTLIYVSQSRYFIHVTMDGIIGSSNKTQKIGGFVHPWFAQFEY